MLKRFCLILLFCIPLTFAQNETANIVLTLVDALSKEPIDDVYVSTGLNGATASYFLEKDETLKLKLSAGEYRAKILINDPSTEGYDYYGETFLPVENTLIKVIYLYPVGSLSGFVKDKLDTAIADADLKFDCNKALTVDFPQSSDNFGSFSLEYVPVGNCKISARYKESLGVGEIEIKQGAKNFIDVTLDTVLIPPQSRNVFLMAFAIPIIIVLVIAFIVYYFTKKTRALEKKEKKEEQEIHALKEEIEEVRSLEDLGKREKDIFKTLRDNEKKIVEFLLEQKEPVYFSKIHFKTGLSKGSLFRNLQSLERKNIVETIKEGKVRKVKLSGWFLGK